MAEMTEPLLPKSNKNLKNPSAGENRKKKAKLDSTSVKYILDQTAIEVVKKGFVKDTIRERKWGKLFGGTMLVVIGLYAQFFPEKFFFTIPEKKQYIKSRCTSGLALSSKVSRSSDLCTLIISSADATSSWDNPPVKLTKTFTEWFDSEGVLMEDLYSKEVEELLSGYVSESNERGMWGSLLLTLMHWLLMTCFLLALLKLVEAMVQ